MMAPADSRCDTAALAACPPSSSLYLFAWLPEKEGKKHNIRDETGEKTTCEPTMSSNGLTAQVPEGSAAASAKAARPATWRRT
jgi:hypothetical protein